MTQEQVASTEPVSIEEPVSVVGETIPKVETPPEPSPEEKMAALVSKMVAEEVNKLTMASKREIQSAKDKATAEVNTALKRARLAESTLVATRTHLQTLDPEVANEMELAELRAREQSRQTLEQEEQMAQYQQTVFQRFHENMTQHIINLGINPTDGRVDWAGDAPDLLTAQSRILDSVSKIQKENVKSLEMSLDNKIKESEKRIKKELGGEDVNSVSAQMSGGVSSKGIPTDIKRFRDWVGDLPMSEYEKLRPEIEKMMAEGKIK